MEVASPLAFGPGTGGAKRPHACSPQLVDTSNISSLSDMNIAEDNHQRTSKRRRFHADTSIDALSEDFSSHSLFFKKNITPSMSIFSNQGAHRLKLLRQESTSPVNEDLKKTINEQAAAIETLKSEKSDLESTLSSLQRDHERVTKENQILRRAVTIQQERYVNTDNELKTARIQRAESDERIRCLEQMILSLRYHLQAQETHRGNDFMHQPPPDVF